MSGETAFAPHFSAAMPAPVFEARLYGAKRKIRLTAG
jgi:hypothetical protein